MQKFTMTSNKKIIRGYQVTQIQALIDIPSVGVKKGDLGGWIQEPHSLSQVGSCWVDKHAFVFNDSKVAGDVHVTGYSKVFDESELQGKGKVKDCVITKTMTIGEFEFEDSELHNVHLPKKAEVRHSNLKNMETRAKARQFKCFHSTLQFASEGELLEGSSRFEHTTIKSSHSMFQGRIQLKEVEFDVGDNECHIYGLTKLSRVKAIDEPVLYLSAVTIEGQSKEHSILLGGDICDIEKTTIKGFARIEGEVTLQSCELDGDIQIKVGEAGLLQMRNSTIQDMVTLEVEPRSKPVIQHEAFTGDGHYRF